MQRCIEIITSGSALSSILPELGRKTLCTPFKWMHTALKSGAVFTPQTPRHWWHDVKVAAADTAGMEGSTLACTEIQDPYSNPYLYSYRIFKVYQLQSEEKCAAGISSLLVHTIHVLLFITDRSYFDSQALSK